MEKVMETVENESEAVGSTEDDGSSEYGIAAEDIKKAVADMRKEQGEEEAPVAAEESVQDQGEDEEEDDSPVEDTGEEESDGAAVKFSDEVLGLASQYGISADQAHGFSSESDLRKALALQDKLATASLKSDSVNDSQDGSSNAANGNVSGGEKMSFLDGAEDFDDRIVTAFDKMGSQAFGRISQLEAKLDQALGVINQYQTEKLTGEIDNFFGSIDGLEDVFGKGGYSDVSGNKTALANRERALDMANALAIAYEKQGKPPLSFKELLDRAVKAEFSEHVFKSKEKDMKRKVEQRLRGGVSRPTNKTESVKLSPYDSAVDKVAKWQADHASEF